MTELGADQSSCCNAVVLTALPAIPSATYTWYSSASNFTTSLQSGTSNTFSASNSATYKCLVTYSNQTAWDYVKVSIGLSCCKLTGIAEANTAPENTFYAMPNPADDKATIKYSLPEYIKRAKIDISDISGKLIKSLNVTSENTSVDLDCKLYANGIYFYSLNIDGRIINSKKLVIVK